MAKETVTTRDLKDVDAAIEQYLLNGFGVNVNFDVSDALRRLMTDGIVTQRPDGTFVTLPPAEAAEHVDAMWDRFLDDLPDKTRDEGHEFDKENGEAAS